MQLHVQYFGHLRLLAGRGEDSLELEAWPATVGELRSVLRQARPALADALGSTAIAIGDAIVSDTDAIGHGEPIALLPPVSGG